MPGRRSLGSSEATITTTASTSFSSNNRPSSNRVSHIIPNQYPPWMGAFGDVSADSNNNDGEPSRSGKRSRVALACTRCKTRKQKCDGAQPCGKCTLTNNRCEYIVPQKPMPFGKNQYIKALERRVAELETVLSRQGVAELSRDHWDTTTTAASGPDTGEPIAATRGHQAESVSSEGHRPQDAHESPGSEPADSAEAILDWQDGVDSVVSVLRCLSLDVNGSGYMGASSHVAIGRLFSFLGRGLRPQQGERNHYKPRRRSTVAPLPMETDGPAPIELADVGDAMADRLFQGYLKHIATRWPVVHSVWVKQVHDRRRSLTDAFEKSILHLVYATAGRFIETTGEPGPFNFKSHYVSAVGLLDVILSFNDLKTVQVLMLMAVYCLRDSGGAGAWTCSRTALLIAIDHGLHRQTKALSRLSMENQLRKRLFWACYAFDRQISIPMGRPFGISDRDIDLELPLDINEDTTDDKIAQAVPGSRSRSTSLTSFLLIIRLRQIESDIQQTIYRVDDSIMIDDALIDEFLARLERWRSMIPQDTLRFTDSGSVPFDGYDFYVSCPGLRDCLLIANEVAYRWCSTTSASDYCFTLRYPKAMLRQGFSRSAPRHALAFAVLTSVCIKLWPWGTHLWLCRLFSWLVCKKSPVMGFCYS
jgi:hypothetical protein